MQRTIFISLITALFSLTGAAQTAVPAPDTPLPNARELLQRARQ